MYNVFIFEDYSFDPRTGIATYEYSFDGERKFTEQVEFTHDMSGYDSEVLDRALRLSFLLLGTSYYKCFPTRNVKVSGFELSNADVTLLNRVYRDGLSQFIFENKLSPENLAVFTSSTQDIRPIPYNGSGILVLQSGGKDSLLLATILNESGTDFSTWYISSAESYPNVLNNITTQAPRVVRRNLDREAIMQARSEGGLNGHTPITYMVQSLALVDAVLHNENIVLTAIGREGEEAHAYIGELAINHQWSKTWSAEKLLSDYIANSISIDLHVGSPLRGYSELRIAELFAEKAWTKFGHRFSSCNLANYMQGEANEVLTWCGNCPKCANSFLLFAPFIEPVELISTIGSNLFAAEALADTFKGLLGIDNVMKPFECVGEIDELRSAYHMARQRFGVDVYALPFEVPESSFDYRVAGEMQDWAKAYITNVDGGGE